MCLGVDDFSFITVGPFKQEPSILGGFLKCSCIISLIIFLFPLSGIPVSWLVDCRGLSFIPLFYLYFRHFVLFSSGGFLYFMLILPLDFLCWLLSYFYLQEVFFARLFFCLTLLFFCFVIMDILLLCLQV